MVKTIILAAIALGVSLGSSSIALAGDIPKALRACKACHFFDQGAEAKKNNLGPGLKGVVGRKITISDVGTLGDTWTEEALDIWLTNPKKVKPGTKMTYKQKKEKKRKATIEALKGI